MNNIVILVGSMRKGGNTDLLAQAFAEGARENNSVEIVSVADYKVYPCIGCNSCFAREGNKCFQNDDMDEIYEKRVFNRETCFTFGWGSRTAGIVRCNKIAISACA